MEDGVGGQEDEVEAVGVVANQKARSAVDVVGGHRPSAGGVSRRRFLSVEKRIWFWREGEWAFSLTMWAFPE